MEASIHHHPVPKIIDDVGGFSCLDRNFSWLRPGYVEGIYQPN